MVLGKQYWSQKLNHPDKIYIYSGQNSVLDTFVSDPEMSEHKCPDYEHFSVVVKFLKPTPTHPYIYIYIYISTDENLPTKAVTGRFRMVSL